MDKILHSEDNTAKLRTMFKEADTDYSGFLSADELYGLILKNKIDIKFDELIEMMSEFEADGDAKLNIDEFISLMTSGEDLSFYNAKSRDTFLKIKSGTSDFNFAEVLKQFSSMPMHFVPSFFSDQAKVK